MAATTTDGTVIVMVARDASDHLSALGTEASTVVPLSIDTGATVPPTGAMSGNIFGGQMSLESVIIGAQRGEAGVNHGTATCRLGGVAIRGIATTRIIIIGGD